jgi:type I restriction enzyme S subunit
MNISRFGGLELSEIKSVPANAGTQRVEIGDVLFNNTNSPALVGKTTAITISAEMAYSNHMTRIRAASGIDPRFLALQLHWYWECGVFRRLLVNHVNQASVSTATLARDVFVALAPAAEQRRVVAEIEKQFTRLDSAIKAVLRSVRRIERYRRAVLHRALEGTLVEGASRATWTAATLSDVVVSLRNGISPKPDATSGVKVLRINAVRPLSVRMGEYRFLRSDLDHFDGFDLQRDDILFTRYNGSPDLVGVCGRVRAVDERVLYPDKLIRARVRKDLVLPAFVEIAANAGETRAFVRSRVRTTAGQAGVSGGDLKSAPFSYPSMPDQERIVAEVERRLSVADELEKLGDASLARCGKLRQSILKRAFEGNLVPQDPNDEPASVLLERIRGERAAKAASKPMTKRGNARRVSARRARTSAEELS